MQTRLQRLGSVAIEIDDLIYKDDGIENEVSNELVECGIKLEEAIAHLVKAQCRRMQETGS